MSTKTELLEKLKELENTIKALEEKFDWSTARPGMAFREKYNNRIVYYAAPFYLLEDTHVIIFSKLNEYSKTVACPEGTFKDRLTRTPEYDLKV